MTVALQDTRDGSFKPMRPKGRLCIFADRCSAASRHRNPGTKPHLDTKELCFLLYQKAGAKNAAFGKDFDGDLRVMVPRPLEAQIRPPPGPLGGRGVSNDMTNLQFSLMSYAFRRPPTAPGPPPFDEDRRTLSHAPLSARRERRTDCGSRAVAGARGWNFLL